MEWIATNHTGINVTESRDVDCRTAFDAKVLAIEFFNAGNSTISIKYGGVTRTLVPGAEFALNCDVPYTYMVTVFNIKFLPVVVGAATNLLQLSVQKTLA